MKDLLAPLESSMTVAVLTVFFLLLFLGLCFFVFSRRRKEVYCEIEKLPLNED